MNLKSLVLPYVKFSNVKYFIYTQIFGIVVTFLHKNFYVEGLYGGAEVWDSLNWYDVYAKFQVNMPICCKVIMWRQQPCPYKLEQYAKYSRVEMASSDIISIFSS